VAGAVGVALVAGWAVVTLGVLVEHPEAVADPGRHRELLARTMGALAATTPLLAGLGAAAAVLRAHARGIVRGLDATGAPRWPWLAWAASVGAVAGLVGDGLATLGASWVPDWSRVPGAWVRDGRILADEAGGVLVGGAARSYAWAWGRVLLGAGCALAGAALALRWAVSAPGAYSAPSGGRRR
jgi:hypothetical protein